MPLRRLFHFVFITPTGVTMWNFETVSYVVGIPASVFCGIMLFAIGLTITRPEAPQFVRRHTGANRYWSMQPEETTRSEGVLHVSHHTPRHYADPLEDPTDVMGENLESRVQVGRRGVESPVRHVPVPHDWVPYMGDLRIALLETATAQYLFARKPKDQLDMTRTQFIYSHAYTG